VANIFSKPTGYAIRALIYLIENREDGSILSADISVQEDVPLPYLGKVLGTLTQAGIVVSTRGPNGGYRLSCEPETITLRRLAELFETQSSSRECLLGFNECPGPKYCAVHRRWLEPQDHIDRFLDNTTMADIVAEDRERRTQIKQAQANSQNKQD
jgi:Rrf2 family transcriptional regulator, iron-sulfur cluster assembly transcription factor